MCIRDSRMNPTATPNQLYATYSSRFNTWSNPPQNIMMQINIYSSNGKQPTASNPSYSGGSNQCFAGSAPTGSILDVNGVFWGGWCMTQGVANPTSLAVLLAPSPADILNYVDVWMYGAPNMGIPLATVVQTAGSVSNLTQTGAYAPLPVASPPASGYLKLPLFLTQIILQS